MNQEKVKNNLSHMLVLLNETLAEFGTGLVSLSKEKNVIKVIKPNLIYSLNIRAFLKQHAKSLAGPKKFVLILAYLIKGKTQESVTSERIKKIWNDNSGLLGGKLTTGMYSTRAKENGWIDSSKE